MKPEAETSAATLAAELIEEIEPEPEDLEPTAQTPIAIPKQLKRRSTELALEPVQRPALPLPGGATRRSAEVVAPPPVGKARPTRHATEVAVPAVSLDSAPEPDPFAPVWQEPDGLRPGGVATTIDAAPSVTPSQASASTKTQVAPPPLPPSALLVPSSEASLLRSPAVLPPPGGRKLPPRPPSAAERPTSEDPGLPPAVALPKGVKPPISEDADLPPEDTALLVADIAEVLSELHPPRSPAAESAADAARLSAAESSASALSQSALHVASAPAVTGEDDDEDEPSRGFVLPAWVVGISGWARSNALALADGVRRKAPALVESSRSALAIPWARAALVGGAVVLVVLLVWWAWPRGESSTPNVVAAAAGSRADAPEARADAESAVVADASAIQRVKGETAAHHHADAPLAEAEDEPPEPAAPSEPAAVPSKPVAAPSKPEANLAAAAPPLAASKATTTKSSKTSQRSSSSRTTTARPAAEPAKAAAAAPKPAAAASEPNAADLLTEAEAALRKGQASAAYSLAMRSNNKKKSDRALRVMTLASCSMKNKTQARSAFDRLPIGERPSIRTECRKRGTLLGL